SRRRRWRSNPVSRLAEVNSNPQACLVFVRAPSRSVPQNSTGAGDETKRTHRVSPLCTFHSVLRLFSGPAATGARLPEAFPRARLENQSTGRSADGRLDWPGTGLRAPR